MVGCWAVTPALGLSSFLAYNWLWACEQISVCPLALKVRVSAHTPYDSV